MLAYKLEKYKNKIINFEYGGAKVAPTPTINNIIIKKVKIQLEQINHPINFLSDADDILKTCYNILREIIQSFSLDSKKAGADELIDRLIVTLDQIYRINPKQANELFSTSQTLIEQAINENERYQSSDDKHIQELYVSGFQVFAALNYIRLKYHLDGD